MFKTKVGQTRFQMESKPEPLDCPEELKHFGVSLPHSSSAIRRYGTPISLNNILPGDIVCYDGHVGIYVGNNRIISASNKRDGIKYNNITIRKIITIRRIFM